MTPLPRMRPFWCWLFHGERNSMEIVVQHPLTIGRERGHFQGQCLKCKKRWGSSGCDDCPPGAFDG